MDDFRLRALARRIVEGEKALETLRQLERDGKVRLPPEPALDLGPALALEPLEQQQVSPAPPAVPEKAVSCHEKAVSLRSRTRDGLRAVVERKSVGEVFFYRDLVVGANAAQTAKYLSEWVMEGWLARLGGGRYRRVR